MKNRKIKKLKLIIVFIILFSLSLLYYIIRACIDLSSMGIDISISTILLHFRWDDLLKMLADTCFSTALIALVFEAFISKETEENIRTLLRNEILVSTEYVRTLDKTEQQQLVSAGIKSQESDEKMANELIALIDSSIKSSERWMDQRYNVSLSQEGNNYFATITLSYVTNTPKSIYKFAVVNSASKYNMLLNAQEYDFLWLSPDETNYSFGTVPEEQNTSFELLYFAIDEQQYSITTKEIASDNLIKEFSVKTKKSKGKQQLIRYKYKCLVEGHSISTSCVHPTYQPIISFDYSLCDSKIEDVDVFSYFYGEKLPKISNDKKTKIVSIEYPGWAFPGGGAVFVWNES